MNYEYCEIPIEPRGKGRPRFTREGHAYTPKETRQYEATVANWYANVAHCGKLEGPLRVSLKFMMPIPASWSKSKQAAAVNGRIKPDKKPDADNLVKAVLDGLNGIAWDDDKQIVELHAEKRYSALPRICVDIQEVTDDVPERAELVDGRAQNWSEDAEVEAEKENDLDAGCGGSWCTHSDNPVHGEESVCTESDDVP